jgi:bacterioferritin
MGNKQQPGAPEISLSKLIDLLNEDLSRQYLAIMIYATYSQMVKGAAQRDIAKVLERKAREELQHALTMAKQIHSLGGIPKIKPHVIEASDNPEQMLRLMLENENGTICHYRERVRQCEALGKYAMAEQIGEILLHEQQHQVALTAALANQGLISLGLQ